MTKHIAATVLLATAIAGIPGSADAQTVGSASLATNRSCASTAASAVCDGTGPGQTIVTRSYGGGVGVAGFNGLDAGGGNVAWSDSSFTAFGLPVIRAFTQAPGDRRMNINAFAFQSFLFGGASGTPFSLTSDLHIVDSSNNPAGGALPGGAIYSQYVGIWDPSIIAGLTTAQELFSALFYADCSTAGVLGFGTASGDLPGGSQNFLATTSSCGVGPLTLMNGQEVLVVSGLQLPVNRGGFADSTATYTTRFDSALSQSVVQELQNGLSSAIARGASITNVSAVPEPATWLTMILGFFMAGSVMRKSRARQAGAAAVA